MINNHKSFWLKNNKDLWEIILEKRKIINNFIVWCIDIIENNTQGKINVNVIKITYNNILQDKQDQQSY